MKNINLLPNEHKLRRRKIYILKTITAGLAVVFLFLILLVNILSLSLSYMNDHIAYIDESLKNNFNSSQEVFNNLRNQESLGSDLNTINEIIFDNEKDIYYILEIINNITPSQVYFTAVYFNQENSFLKISGYSEEGEYISDFLKSLYGTKLFSSIEITEFSLVENSDEGQTFSLYLYIK